MTLREAIERGLVSMDEIVTLVHWDPDNPEQPTDPDEVANSRDLPVGAVFEMWRGLQFGRAARYRVTGTMDDDEGTDYECVEVPAP